MQHGGTRNPSRRAIRLLFAIVLIDGTIAGLVGPIQPEFVAGTNSPAAWITASSLVFVALGFFAAPAFGAYSDSHGRRPVLIGAGVLTVIGAVVLLPVRLPFLMLNRVFDGSAQGAYGTLRSAIVDASEPRVLARNTGLIDTIASIGFVLGPAVASLVLVVATANDVAPAPAIVAASIVLGVVSLVLCVALPQTRAIAPTRDAPAVTTVMARALLPNRLYHRARALSADHPRVWTLLVAEFWLNVGLGYYFYFITLLAEGLQLGPQGIANVSAYWAVILIVAQLVFFGRFVHRVDRLRWIRVLLLVGVVVMAGYAVVEDRLWLLLVVAAIDCLTVSFVPGLLEGLAAEAVPEHTRGELFGIRQSVSSMAWVIALVIATALSEWWIGAPFLVFGTAFVACWWSIRSIGGPAGP